MATPLEGYSVKLTIFAGWSGWYPHWRDQMRGPDSGVVTGPSSDLNPVWVTEQGPDLMKFKFDIRHERNSKLPEVWQRVHLF